MEREAGSWRKRTSLTTVSTWQPEQKCRRREGSERQRLLVIRPDRLVAGHATDGMWTLVGLPLHQAVLSRTLL